MRFKPSRASEEFIENVHQRVGARNKAVLGRSALFLALGEGVPSSFKSTDSQGKDLDDETVIGNELGDVVRAALNHRVGKRLNESEYRQEFRQHFEYGCQRLKQIWEESRNDQTRFVAALLKIADPGFGENRKSHVAPMPVVEQIVEQEVKLKVLAEAPEWSINGPDTKNGLLVISGEPGSGKSQLALDLLAQLSNQGVRFVFFDLKGELEDDPNNPQQGKNRAQFLEQTGARYIRLIRQSLPINPLYRSSDLTRNAQIAYEIAGLIRCFARQLGAKQERSISDTYQQLPTPDFSSLALQLEQNGAEGVDLAIIQKINRLNIFANAPSSLGLEEGLNNSAVRNLLNQEKTTISLEEWLSSSIVIDFKDIGNDSETKALVVALILNFLMKHLNQNLAVKNSIQPVKMVLFVDEAHLLLPKEGKAGLLGSLARQGRSWGFPVWLASQDADAFVTTGDHATNFAELAECGVHFSPHTLSGAQQKKVLGGFVRHDLKKAEAALRLQGNLTVASARQFWKDQGS
ncbi:MAG: DndE family protein [Desulfurellaceae bacterium]|nr:DndE family protein [Desulfurellaceae bacterium]